MVRFVLVLLLAGGLWFGYRELAPAAPADASADVGVAAEDELGSPPSPTPEPGPLQAPAKPGPDAGARPELDELIAGLEHAAPEARARALAVLAAESGAARERLTQAIAAAASTADAAGTVALLGANNAFLHSDPGRRLAREAIARADRQPDEQAVVTLSRLVELCMKGPISKADAEARATVGEAWAALQRSLRKTVLNPAYTARARSYKVPAGGALERIARHFRQLGYKVDAGTLAAFNRIDDPRRLRAGQVLKVPVDPIRTVVEKHSFLAAVYVGDLIFRLYWVGHGKEDRTPETTFTIGAKQAKPDWYAPDGRVLPYGHPDNVLGDYFVKFDHASFSGFGAHGTSEPETIGATASAGCLRMADPDIADFFAVIPSGTPVEIRASR